MVIMQGDSRVLETPILETSSSATVRTADIYGITAYSQLENKVFGLISTTAGSDASTLNINNLGAVSIMKYSNGSLVALTGTWVGVGQIYYVTYNGSYFVLVSNTSSAQTQTNVEKFSLDILSLTNAATESDITTAFGTLDDIVRFTGALINNKLVLFVDITNGETVTATHHKLTSTGSEITVLYQGAVTTYAFTNSSQTTGAYESVVVTSISL